MWPKPDILLGVWPKTDNCVAKNGQLYGQKRTIIWPKTDKYVGVWTKTDKHVAKTGQICLCDGQKRTNMAKNGQTLGRVVKD